MSYSNSTNKNSGTISASVLDCLVLRHCLWERTALFSDLATKGTGNAIRNQKLKSWGKCAKNCTRTEVLGREDEFLVTVDEHLWLTDDDRDFVRSSFGLLAGTICPEKDDKCGGCSKVLVPRDKYCGFCGSLVVRELVKK
jgi:hypothetical protein